MAVATLALGIGACTAMFSIVWAVILKTLPFGEPDRLVWIENIGTGGLSARTSRADVFSGWRDQNHSFAALGAYFAFSDYGTKVMAGAGEPERVRDVGISDNFLDVLGVRPLHGRNFTAQECTSVEPVVVILSHAFWQRRFGGDPGVIGRAITINQRAVSIVGVLPESFDFDAIFTPGSEVDLLTPFPLTAETARWGNTVFGIGRLRHGVTPAAAQAELEVINDRLSPTLPQAPRQSFGARVSRLDDALRGRFRGAFYLLTAAVGCILAIACVNLSNLMLARFNVRRQEFAVRVSLGARRGHLLRQTLAETLLLASGGALVGLPVAVAATAVLARLETFGVPMLQDAHVGAVSFAIAIGLTMLAGLACALLPALYLSRLSGSSVMQGATHQRTAGRSAVHARHALVVAEVALAFTLLVGAGLLLRSFNSVLQVKLGFQPEHALSWRLAAVRPFASNAEHTAYFDELVTRIARLPGVSSVGLTDTLPLSRNRTWGAGLTGESYAPGEYPIAFPRMIDRHYLQAMGITVRRGRGFDERDAADGPKAILVNENLARRLVPNGDALGRMINVNDGSTIVGIVANVRHRSLEEGAGYEMYLDYHQTEDWGALDLVVRSSRPAASLVPEVRAVLAAFDPSLPNGEFQPLDHLVDNAVAPRRLIARLLAVFSFLALTLAALGLFGVISYSMAQRTPEFGIRMAVGAQRGQILWLVLRGVFTLVGVGIILGAAGAVVLARFLQSQLYGVSGHDPLTLGGVAAILLAAAAAASLLPALRATRVDPLVALRGD